MNIRKILNVLVVVAIIGAISAVFINLYNKNKLDAEGFNTSNNEEIDSKKDSKKKDNKSNEDDKEELPVSSDDNNNDTTDDNDVSSEGVSNEVSVESTSSFKNNYVAVLGSTIILLGIGTIVTKKNI